MRNHFAALGYPSGKAGDQPAQRIDFLLVSLRKQMSALMRLKHFDRRTRIGNQASIGTLDETRSVGHVMLVFDLADDLLDEIFDRYQPINTAEFVNNHRDMSPRLAHLNEEVEYRYRRRNKQQLA